MKFSIGFSVCLTVLAGGVLGLVSLRTPRGAVRGAPTPGRVRQVAGTSARQSLLNVPLSFEPNWGQMDAEAKFVSRGIGSDAFLTSKGMTFVLKGRAAFRVAPSLSGER